LFGRANTKGVEEGREKTAEEMQREGREARDTRNDTKKRKA
jgi:hypothetical protein